jgi:hypothetical protein
VRRRTLVRWRLGGALVGLCLIVPGEAMAGSTGALAQSPRSTVSYTLNSIACVSTSRCWAVGYDGSTVFNYVPLAERWKSGKWTSVTVPPSSGEPSNSLGGVACVSSSFCWAVGASLSPELDATTLMELWNGHKWSPYPQSDAGGLGSVACVAQSDCWAVGSYIDGYGAHATYAERWTESNEGSHWAEGIIAVPTGARASGLSSVACVSSRDCIAVGSYTTSSGVPVTLAERFDGTSWKVTETPNPKGATGSYLDGVTCTGPTSCTAVGYYRGSGAILYPSLAEHWNGTAWKLMTTPNAKNAVGGSILNAIACSSSTSCTAVGYSSSDAGHFTLVEQLKGTTWKVVRSRNPSGSTGNFLNSVACPSAESCTAVGYQTQGGVQLTLGEHWNGTTWTVVTTPG